MPYMAPEIVDRARQIDLLSYLKQQEPGELVHVGGNVYSTKTHDSLKISNGMWTWWSRGIGGRSALDYLIKVRGMSFLAAVEQISDGNIIVVSPPIQNAKPPASQQTAFSLPEANVNNAAVLRYLAGRCISPYLLQSLVAAHRIYESKNCHNAVFVGIDESGTPRYAVQRGTGQQHFFRETPGSDKRYAFCTRGSGRVLHVFEGAIDLLSYASGELYRGQTWGDDPLLSLGGINQGKELPAALTHYLAQHPGITDVCLHLDNDAPGRAATAAILARLPKEVVGRDCPPAYGKDMNDELCHRLALRTRECVR